MVLERSLSFFAISLLAVGCGGGEGAADAGQDVARPAVDAPVLAEDTAQDPADAEPVEPDAAASEDAPGPFVDASSPIGTMYADAVALGDLDGVPETSGIVASRDHAGIYWVHNDSGNPDEIYAIDEGARIVATITLPDADNRDWEEITLLARDGTDAIFIGDHGDNEARTTGGASSSRPGYVRIYRLDEPDPAAGDASATTTELRLEYPDGPHDCEGMFVDSATGDLYLFSKVDSGTAALYVARAPLAEPGPTRMERVADVEMIAITAADLSGDGRRLVVRNYSQIRVFDVTTTIGAALGGTPRMPRSPSAAEAIAFERGSWNLVTIAEGDGATLYRIAWE